MKIDAIIVGSLHGAAKRTTDATGNSIVTAVVLAPIREGDAYIYVSFNIICVDETAAKALVALTDGDSVAIAGELSPEVMCRSAHLLEDCAPQSRSLASSTSVCPSSAIFSTLKREARPSLDLIAHAVLTEYHVARKRTAVHERAPADAEDEAA